MPEVRIEEQPAQDDHGFVTDVTSDHLLDFIGSGQLSKIVLNSPLIKDAIQRQLDTQQQETREQGLGNLPLVGCFKTGIGKETFGEYSTAECLKAKFANW